MNLKISEDHPPTIGGWFLSFLLGRNIGFYNVFARCLGLTALRKNVKNLANSIPNISCMWSCTISRLFPWHKPGVFPWHTQQKKHFRKLFWWCSHNPKPCSGLCLWGRGLLWPPKPENRCHESQLSSQSEPKKIPRLICHCMSQNWMLMVSCEQPLSLPRHPQNLTLQLPTFKGWPPKAKHLASSFQAPVADQHASEEHLTSHNRCKSQRRCLELYLGDLGGKARVRHFQVPNRIPYVPWLWSLLLCVCFVRWIFQ